MSSDQTTEERSLPPSQRKLKELRKKAHVSRSSDMVAGAAGAAALLYLWLETHPFIARFKGAISAITKPDRDLSVNAYDAAVILFSSAAQFVVGLFAVVMFTVIATNILVNRGFLFSLEPVKFDLGKINPAEGLKRMFSIRTAIEALKGGVKLAIFLTLSVILFAASMRAAFHVPYCDADCFATVFGGILKPIIILAIALLLLGGIIDVSIQQWLFLRQHKMTKSEAKRDHKETEGAPELRQNQRRLRGEMLEGTRRYKPEEATVFIEGADTIVGLRFVRGETPVPVVVTKAQGQNAIELKDLALDNKIPVYADDELSSSLFQQIDAGRPIKEEFFQPFIKALIALRLL
jgi:type III secretion protein U